HCGLLEGWARVQNPKDSVSGEWNVGDTCPGATEAEVTNPGRIMRHMSRSNNETEVPNYYMSRNKTRVGAEGLEPLTPCMPCKGSDIDFHSADRSPNY